MVLFVFSNIEARAPDTARAALSQGAAPPLSWPTVVTGRVLKITNPTNRLTHNRIHAVCFGLNLIILMEKGNIYRVEKRLNEGLIHEM